MCGYDRLERSPPRKRVDAAVVAFVEHDIDIIVGTIDLGKRGGTMLVDSVATALRLGGGSVVANAGKDERLYSERLYCGRCGIGYEALDLRLFSFNSRQRACPTCDGIGSAEENRVDDLRSGLPTPSASVAQRPRTLGERVPLPARRQPDARSAPGRPSPPSLVPGLAPLQRAPGAGSRVLPKARGRYSSPQQPAMLRTELSERIAADLDTIAAAEDERQE